MIGTYMLIIEVKNDKKIRIGKLGEIDFKNGYYCYVGSALGKSVNLDNRIKRHTRLNNQKKGKLHWHIDYLLANPDANIVGVRKIQINERLECHISQLIGKVADNFIKDFGCSDCNCKSHLYYFDYNNIGVLKNLAMPKPK